jgi:hypothetical protein
VIADVAKKLDMYTLSITKDFEPPIHHTIFEKFLQHTHEKCAN